MLARLPATICLLALMFQGATAFGQPSQEEARKQSAAFCQKGIDIVSAKLIAQLDAYPALKSKPDLVLLIPVADFNAFADYTRTSVLIPVMWCVQTWMLIDALSQAYTRPELREPYKRYVVYLQERQQRALRLRQAFDLEPIQDFNQFAGTARVVLGREQENRAVYARESTFFSALGFVIGHELGHLALRHKPSKEITSTESRRQEHAADRFAAELLKKAGLDVVPAMLTLQRFLQDEAWLKGNPASSRTHPRAECRLERIVFHSGELNEMFSSPKYRREFEENSGYSVPQFRELMRELKSDCAQNP